MTSTNAWLPSRSFGGRSSMDLDELTILGLLVLGGLAAVFVDSLTISYYGVIT